MKKTIIYTVEFTDIVGDYNDDNFMKREFVEWFEGDLKKKYAGFDHIKVSKIQQLEFPDQPKAPKLTKKEKAFCELTGSGYIARDDDTDLWWHEFLPKKSKVCGWVSGGQNIHLDVFDEISFSFIHWEDDLPWAVEDLLKLEVE